MAFCFLLSSCSAVATYHENETNPICREKRRTCAEYERLVAAGANNSSAYLREIRASCNSHSYACARAVEEAK